MFYSQIIDGGDNNIRENMETIDKIFHNYDKNYLKVVEPSILVNKLRKIHCTNPMINNQMKALSKNIMVLEKIEKDYGSLDNFVNKETPNDIANMFNDGKWVEPILLELKLDYDNFNYSPMVFTTDYNRKPKEMRFYELFSTIQQTSVETPTYTFDN